MSRQQGTSFETQTRQVVTTDFRLALRRDRSYPRNTQLVVIDEHGVATSLMEFTRNGTFRRCKDVYVRGLASDDTGRFKEEQ